MRSEVTVVTFVCVSVNQHPTFGASVRPENDITYSTGNEGQNICVDFSETAPLQRYTASCIVWLSSLVPRSIPSRPGIDCSRMRQISHDS